MHKNNSDHLSQMSDEAYEALVALLLGGVVIFRMTRSNENEEVSARNCKIDTRYVSISGTLYGRPVIEELERLGLVTSEGDLTAEARLYTPLITTKKPRHSSYRNAENWTKQPFPSFRQAAELTF